MPLYVILSTFHGVSRAVCVCVCDAQVYYLLKLFIIMLTKLNALVYGLQIIRSVGFRSSLTFYSRSRWHSARDMPCTPICSSAFPIQL